MSVADPEPTRENFALTGTVIDDGSDEYYDGTSVKENLNDGNLAAGWQYQSNNTDEDADNPITEETPNAYTTDEGASWHVAMVFEDGIYVGYTWEEAVTINELQIYYEFGSRPVCSTEGYVIEVTTDGEDWEELEDAEYTYIETETAGVAEADVITFEATDVKGVRTKIYKSSTKYSPKVWEFEVYGPEAEAEGETEAEAETETETEAE